MAGRPRSKVHADIKKNRLYIVLSCDPDKEVLDRLYTDVRFCVADLRPGFDVITDLSQCTIGHLNGVSTLRKIMDYLTTNQVGRIIRVLGPKSLLFKQLFRISSLFQGYKAAYVTSLTEAEERLAGCPVKGNFRIRPVQQEIEYRVQQKGEKGQLLEISLNGCTVQAMTSMPAKGLKISLTIPAAQDQPAATPIIVAARVIRARNEIFIARFAALNKQQREELYNYLASEARREIALG